MKDLKYIIFYLIITASNTLLFAQETSCKVLTNEIANEYKGGCLNGLAHGKGKAKGKDQYSGSFKKGLPHGKGKYTYENGNLFSGYWKEGMKEGKGQFKYKLNGQSYTQKGYWKKGEYVGTSNPDIGYRITASTGIMNKEVIKKEGDNKIYLYTMSAMTKFLPRDIIINTSSGQINQQGKAFEISEIVYPFNCEVSYSISITPQTRKQCRFTIEIIKEGKYEIILHND